MTNLGLFGAVISAIFLSFPTVLEAQGFRETMTFREMTSGGNCDTCYWIAADGVIERDTADKLKTFLAPCVREVVRCSTFLYFSGGRDRTMTWDIHRNVKLRC